MNLGSVIFTFTFNCSFLKIFIWNVSLDHSVVNAHLYNSKINPNARESCTMSLLSVFKYEGYCVIEAICDDKWEAVIN